LMVFGDGGAPTDAAIQLATRFWSSFGYLNTDKMAALAEHAAEITLASNFGTFFLYMLSCVTCIVCFQGHPQFSFVKHMLGSGVWR